MQTLGVDLAADDGRTAIASVTWEQGRAVVTCLQVVADDNRIVNAIAASDKAGIDCPLGWPTDFVSFVNAHQGGDQSSALGITGSVLRRALSTRLTDPVVGKETGLVPLSVALTESAIPGGITRQMGCPAPRLQRQAWRRPAGSASRRDASQSEMAGTRRLREHVPTLGPRLGRASSRLHRASGGGPRAVQGS
jgi:Protein of unknown function (DUF429)